jgi:hypothetical protein
VKTCVQWIGQRMRAELGGKDHDQVRWPAEPKNAKSLLGGSVKIGPARISMEVAVKHLRTRLRVGWVVVASRNVPWVSHAMAKGLWGATLQLQRKHSDYCQRMNLLEVSTVPSFSLTQCGVVLESRLPQNGQQVSKIYDERGVVVLTSLIVPAGMPCCHQRFAKHDPDRH